MDKRAFGSNSERREFTASLQQDLRHGKPEEALGRVHSKLAELSGADDKLVKLALESRAHNISLKGWDRLGETIATYEKRGERITALGIDFSWPGHVGLEPDSDGKLAPYIETNYYGDLRDLSFTSADRETLLRAYGSYGSEWQGMFIEIDNLINVEGMEGLYGAVQIASSTSDSDDVHGDAYVLAACTSAILLHQAVRHMIERNGLPKPMTVLVGSNEDYPFFDAPVWTVDEGAPPYAGPSGNPRGDDPSKMRGHGAGRQSNRKRHKAPEDFDPIADFAQTADATHEIGKLVNRAADDLKPLLRDKTVMKVASAWGAALALNALKRRR